MLFVLFSYDVVSRAIYTVLNATHCNFVQQLQAFQRDGKNSWLQRCIFVR